MGQHYLERQVHMKLVGALMHEASEGKPRMYMEPGERLSFVVGPACAVPDKEKVEGSDCERPLVLRGKDN